MDRQSLFAGAETGIGFLQRRADLRSGELTEDKESSRVGMPRHIDLVFACQHVQRGMLERMIAPCFKDIGKVEYHIFLMS